MKLPQELQHYPHATLLIASDSVRADFFLLGGDELEKLDGIALPREPRQDSEGTFVSYDGSRAAGPDSDIDDSQRLKQFVKKITEQAEALTREHDIQHVDVVMPAEIEHLLTEVSSNELKNKIRRRSHLDLMKEDPLTIVRRSLETVPPVEVKK
ncbi:host attachment protein [Patescibacteria group bacterium]|nr:host attachment protein [Patescibacteria group bacterium]MBU1629781.1 host attachment protein [Patescibacteria group bacterium]MBU1908298.1 host attachment protein [Patescibacteria group bacterium]